MNDGNAPSLAALADVPAVVLGRWEDEAGINSTSGVNTTSSQTVRELARTRPVLHIYTGLGGSPGDLFRTAFGLHPRPADDTLWLAPLQGLSNVLPLSFPEPLRRHNVRLLRGAIREWLSTIGAPRCLLVCYWWFVSELVRDIPNVLSIYDCTDEDADCPGSLLRARTVRRLEAELLDAVDCSFVVSPALLPPREAPQRVLKVLPNGFDTRVFAELVGTDFEVPEPLRSVEGPLIGCVGGLGGRVDAELVGEIVRRRPDWNFAFIGGRSETALPDVLKLPNVLSVGVMPYREGLRHISRFDVGIIPFTARPRTRGNSFLKLLDYYAYGMPVVATPLPDTVAVAETDGRLIRLAEGPDAWLTALTDALAEPKSSPDRQARRRYAHERSVERRVEHMLAAALEVRAGG